MPRFRRHRSKTLSALRRIPMPVLSILIGLICGGLVWMVLDQVQPPALRDIFNQELQRRLDQQARETLIRFDNYVESHISTTRLLANHRNLASYLEPIYWLEDEKPPPLVYRRNPPWLPDARLWRTLVQPAQILLIDRWGHTREIYSVGNRALPPELLDVDDLFLSKGRVQGVMITLQGKPYLLISERVEDATGTYMGFLMLVVPIDDAFLKASQQGVSASEVVVGLMEVEEQRFLSSSDPLHVPVGERRDQVAKDYVVTAQSFFGYEGSDLNMLFATLVPRSSVEATRQRVEGVERRQRLITSITFISVFTLVFYLLSERLNRLLRRISRFSRRALGGEQPVIERGNQIFVLEDWMRQFIGNVRRARDEMRRQHENEMQESEALKQAIMEAALDAIVTLDEAGHIIEFNTTAEHMFGLQRDDVIGRDFQTLIFDSAGRAAFAALWRRFREQPVDAGTETRSEMEARRADDRRFPVEVAIKPIRLRRRQLFTVYIHDISSRRRAEQEIRNMARFASESPSPILRVSRRGVILYANPASTPLLEYWDCEQGQTLPAYWRDRVTALCDSRTDWEGEISYQDHTYSLLMTPIADLDYVNIYGRDITAIREAESLAREHQQELVHVCRLSTMGEMATGLAHELNQPLAAIANYANGCVRRLGGQRDDGDGLTYALGQINDQAERAGEIIRRLRRLVGKQLPVRNVTDINELVREVCRFVEFEAKKVGVVIEEELSLDPLPVRVDIVQIEQVFLNLVRNALDALLEVPPEQRRLVIRTGRQGGDYIQVDVVDSGPGIATEVQGHLFEPFFTTKQSGMGMGLVISETIVKDHKGRIEAKALDAGGSRFSVILPAYREEEGGDE